MNSNTLLPPPTESDEQPLLKRYKVDFSPDEPITHLVASNKQVVIATKDKKILIIDTSTNEQSICDIGRYFGSRLATIRIYRIFLDPTGKFLLISVAYAADNQPCENLLYVKQIQQLQRLKNYLISSVAWNYSKQYPQQSNGTLTTGTILLGTTKGLVLQTEFTQSDETKFFPLKTGPGHYVKEIFDVGHELGAITGISCNQINSSSSTERTFVILLSTNNRLYRMVGNVPANVDPPPLQQIILQNVNNFKDVPGRVGTSSKLDLYYPSKSIPCMPTRYAWLTEPGVATDELHEYSSDCRTAFESEVSFIKYSDPDESCLPPSLSTPSGMSPQIGGGLFYYDKPISMVVTNFHIIILMRHCLRAICILNSRIVHQEYFLVDHGEALGMSKDPAKNILYVYLRRAIFRYKMSNENKDVWKIFLDLKRFDLAKKYSDGDNHDRVICEEAQHHFDLKDYEKSAEIFATSKKPFEDVCLMLIGTKCDSALRKYLTIRMFTFESDSIQFYMLLSWLFSLLVSRISILEVGPIDERADSDLEVLYQELDQLLEDDQVVDCLRLHANSFYSIIQCYAHRKVEILVARRILDYVHLVQLHLNRCQYDEALAILREAKQSGSDANQRRLWLTLAKQMLNQEGADIRMAAELLDETRLLKLEDVLKFLPNCKTIGPIKGPVVRALLEKQNKLMAIRDGEYEIIANRIRGEIKTFKARYSKLRYGQKCEICAQNIMSRTLYLFPCGHLFHHDCMIREIMTLDPQHKEIEECVLCGSLLASIIDKPPTITRLDVNVDE